MREPAGQGNGTARGAGPGRGRKERGEVRARPFGGLAPRLATEGGARGRKSIEEAGIDLNDVFRFRFVFVFLRSVFVSPLLQNEIKTKTSNEIAKTPFRSIPGMGSGFVKIITAHISYPLAGHPDCGLRSCAVGALTPRQTPPWP